MKNEQKGCKVTIFNESYTLVTDEREELLTVQAASLVDTLMKEISQTYNFADHKKIAVLASLRLAHELLQARSLGARRDAQEKAVLELLDRAMARV
jgi:cell division protein ZapA (FtsZ GTPase activity inhibitor)